MLLCTPGSSPLQPAAASSPSWLHVGRTGEGEERPSLGHFFPPPSCFLPWSGNILCHCEHGSCQGPYGLQCSSSGGPFSPRAAEGSRWLLVGAPLSVSLISAHTSSPLKSLHENHLGWTVSPGTLADATLTTAINSELTWSKIFCHTAPFWHYYHYYHSSVLWLSYKRS